MRTFHGMVSGLCTAGALLASVAGNAWGATSADLRLGLYHNADGSPLIPLIQAAQSAIDIEIYEADDPAVHTAIRDALGRGVKVRVVQEPNAVGLKCVLFSATSGADDDTCKANKKLVADVRAAGGEYVPYNKKAFCPTDATACVQHGKIAMIDHKTAMISSGNFNTTDLCDLVESPHSCHRDYSYVTDDAGILRVLGEVFEKDLAGKTYDLSAILASDTEGRLTVSPITSKELLTFVASAKTSISISTQYLHEPLLNQALLDAANRGVKISVMVSSFCWFGTPSKGDKTKETKTFSAFESAGMTVRTFTQQIKVNGAPGYLHAKAIVVDGDRAWMGSINGSTASVSANREFGLFFNDSASVDELSQHMAADLADSGGESWQDSLNCVKDR